jgi:hypothetical protein
MDPLLYSSIAAITKNVNVLEIRNEVNIRGTSDQQLSIQPSLRTSFFI